VNREPTLLWFLGGTGTVTGSRFLLDAAGARVLVDAGLFQGLKSLRLRNREQFPVDPTTIDAVVATTAAADSAFNIARSLFMTASGLTRFN